MEKKQALMRPAQKEEDRQRSRQEGQSPTTDITFDPFPGQLIGAQPGNSGNHTVLPLQRRAVLQMQRRNGNQQVQRELRKFVHRQDETGEEPALVVAPVSPVAGQGEPTETTAYSLTLEGRTDATYDGGTFSTRNVRTRPGEDCAGCEGADCVHVTGVVVSRFHVTTTVTLPSVNDYPDLTRCQRQRVRAAINNVLRPHEQEHVRAFRQYNGVVRTPFDLTICRADFDSEIQSIHETVETDRQAAAQSASDALDPFNFTVDLDCEE